MKKSRRSFYNLTPLGDGWGIGHRALEIAVQTIGPVVMTPFLLILLARKRNQ